MAEARLTPKQEAFCLAYLETGNASEAYRRAYDAEGMSSNAVGVEAFKLLENPKIANRLAILREPVIKRAQITMEDLLAELEEARKIAIEDRNASPAVAATMGKAKLLGMDKQVLEHTGPNGAPMTPSVIVLCGPDDGAATQD